MVACIRYYITNKSPRNEQERLTEGMPQATHAFADMKIPLKRRKDADDWIDSSVKKAILVDKTNNQITLLKDE